MLTDFLNANKAVIENSTRTGWWADDAKWAEASDRSRRMDKEFDVRAHFKTVSETDLDKARKVLDLAKQKQQGRGRGNRTDTNAQQSRATSSNTHPQQYAAYTTASLHPNTTTCPTGSWEGHERPET